MHLVPTHLKDPGHLKDQVPDVPYLNATTWASHEFLHTPTAHDPPSTMTCPAVKLQDVARVGAPESDGQCLENPPALPAY